MAIYLYIAINMAVRDGIAKFQMEDSPTRVSNPGPHVHAYD